MHYCQRLRGSEVKRAGVRFGNVGLHWIAWRGDAIADRPTAIVTRQVADRNRAVALDCFRAGLLQSGLHRMKCDLQPTCVDDVGNARSSKAD